MDQPKELEAPDHDGQEGVLHSLFHKKRSAFNPDCTALTLACLSQSPQSVTV